MDHTLSDSIHANPVQKGDLRSTIGNGKGFLGSLPVVQAIRWHDLLTAVALGGVE